MNENEVSISRKRIVQSKRWVIKIGSALLTNDGVGLDVSGIYSWVEQMHQLTLEGIEIVLVSSGSVAEGMVRLGWNSRPTEVEKLQAAAAVGQVGLLHRYETEFQKYNKHAAQILLTHADISNRKRYLNARATINQLLSLGVVPIINENDTVITKEIRFGDNDTLSALTANLIDADMLIILTDQEGLFTADPRSDASATLIENGLAQDERFNSMAGEGGALGRGGMITKVKAAQLAARSGTDTIIVGGKIDNVLIRLKNQENLGTFLKADQAPEAARKQWLAGQMNIDGGVVLDRGAVNAIIHQDRSLLPVGVTGVTGRFKKGSIIACYDANMKIIAKGIANYSNEETQQICQKDTAEIEDELGYQGPTELIHIDNIVIV
jgi:glutamate 5-kinase